MSAGEGLGVDGGVGVGFGAEGDDGLLGLAEGVESGDDFLTQIAALGEGDAVVEKFAGLVGDGLGSEVEVVEGCAGFDAGDVESVPAGGAESDPLCGIGCAVVVLLGLLEECVVDGLDGFDSHVEGVAGLGGEIATDGDDFVTGDGESGGLVLAHVGDGRAVYGGGGECEECC